MILFVAALALDSKGSHARYYTESLVDEFDFFLLLVVKRATWTKWLPIEFFVAAVAYEVIFGWFLALGLH